MGAAALAIALAALTLSPGGQAAEPVDTADLQALATGDMRKLTWSDGAEVPAITFQTEDGTEVTLADYAGTPVVLNFWATWCAPCRVEMPHLAQLQDDLGDTATVLTVATGRNDSAAMDRFFQEIGVTNLPKARDPDQSMARSLGVLGLPATLLIDPEGREVARLLGEADWSSDSARAIVTALADG
ncbi:TlpA family protein disulfide reductase [Salipiger sp. IMCC34102]|uniref:TlpA family protein disulfide reductase n=1 Tax=Salipiger sp. IMCC34102 TaxID=2510647 RepID=UPI00101D7429|nr:TlpA disulfide reductase family protein [Salipiger sp. IMCC34102]RYH01391.1 TlpA family protein disulfide reductase [Salipiger sp. IMCC34102]